MARHTWRWARAHRAGVLAAVAAALVTVGLSAVMLRDARRATGGEWIAPIDDTYIHLQYATALAEGRGFSYQRGDGYSGGATSPVWVALLAPAAGTLAPAPLVAFALLAGALCMGGLLLACRAMGTAAGDAPEATAKATADAATRSPGATTAATAALPAMALIGGQGFLWWLALSGMETTLFLAGIAASLALVGRWNAVLVDDPQAPPPRGLWIIAALLPLARPDGLLVSGCIAALLGWRSRLRWRWPRAALVLAPAALALVAHRWAYGRWATAGLEMKAASYLPYVDSAQARRLTMQAALRALHRLWGGGAVGFSPAWASALAALLGVVALVKEWRARRVGPAAMAALLAPAFLWAGATVGVAQFRQDRYFAPAMMLLALLGGLGAGALGGGLAAAVARRGLRPRWAVVALDLAVTALVVAALLPTWTFWRHRYAADVAEIQRKQVSAARWIAANTPADAQVLVCDAGALALLSHRRVFDIVGLTSRHSGNAYLSGAGSRFEEMERAGRSRWPTHAALYSWCGWPGAVIEPLSTHSDLVVSRFSDPGLGSGEAPVGAELAARRALDRLDVADLASEAAHGWREDDGGARVRNVIGRHQADGRAVADGGRVVATAATFTLGAAGSSRRDAVGRTLVLRTEAPAAGAVLITSAARHARGLDGERQALAVSGLAGGLADGFVEQTFAVPDTLDDVIEVRVEAAPGATIPLYSAWLLAPLR
jgi:hypothetical protein